MKQNRSFLSLLSVVSVSVCILSLITIQSSSSTNASRETNPTVLRVRVVSGLKELMIQPAKSLAIPNFPHCPYQVLANQATTAGAISKMTLVFPRRPKSVLVYIYRLDGKDQSSASRHPRTFGLASGGRTYAPRSITLAVKGSRYIVFIAGYTTSFSKTVAFTYGFCTARDAG